ncbi:MAG: GntR family transcriptional regulator [Firmicutes bacterium]|nr:GntR family transcriptional regulator [Bacillota bacterium]
MLNHDSPIPLYYQLEELLRHHIEEGIWPPGTVLPSERELCETYKVSRGPVRQAIKNLEIAGLARAIRGKGVIVNEKKFEPNPLANPSFFKEIERQGMKPSSVVIQSSIMGASVCVSEQLKLTPGASVYMIQRIIRGDDQSLALATTYLPKSLFPDFLEKDLAANAVYDLINRSNKTTIDRVRERFEPILPDKEAGKLLRITLTTPSLLVHRTSFSGVQPVEYTTILVRGDRCLYTLEFPIN